MAKRQKFAVIGLGRFGGRLATILTESGAEVVAIDRDAELVEALRDTVTLAVRLDATNEEALKAQGVDKVDAAIVGIGNDFESAVLAVATLRTLGTPRIFARAETDIQARILSQVGAQAIVNPEREAAYRWAHRLSLPNLQQYVELSEEHSIVYIQAPTAFQNQTLKDLDIRRKYGVNVVAIKQTKPVHSDEGEPVGEASTIIVPTAETVIQPSDVLILVGTNDRLDDLPAD